MQKLYKQIVPSGIRERIQEFANDRCRRQHAPRMLYGYRDPATGQWMRQTRLSSSVVLYHPEKIRIADNVFIWHHTILDGTGGIEIGEGTQIGAWVGIFTHSSHMAMRLYGRHYKEVPEDQKVGLQTAPVKIGRYVAVGAGTIIGPGHTIGDGVAIVGNSYITRDIEPFQAVFGNPAEVIADTRKVDERFLRKHPELRPWYEEWQKADISQKKEPC